MSTPAEQSNPRKCLLCRRPLEPPQPPDFSIADMPLRDAWVVLKEAVGFAFAGLVLSGFIWFVIHFSSTLVGESWSPIAPWLQWAFYALLALGIVWWGPGDILREPAVLLIRLSDQWTRATWIKRISVWLVLGAVVLGFTYVPTAMAVIGVLVALFIGAVENWKGRKKQEWLDQREAEREGAADLVDDGNVT